MRINPNNPIFGGLTGFLSALGARKQQQDALQYQTDARQFEQQDAYRQSLPTQYDAATRSPWFQNLSPEQQTAYGEELSQRAGPYGGRIIPVGSRIGTRTTLAPTGNILQGPPSPAQSADMVAQGVDRPGGGYLEYAQTPSQTVLPPYSKPKPVISPRDYAAAFAGGKSLDPTSYAQYRATMTAQGINLSETNTQAAPLPRPQSPEQIAHLRANDQNDYLPIEARTFDAAATTTLPQKIATMQAANKQREALGLPPLPVVGDVIGQDPTRKIEGPRPEGQQGPGVPVPAPIVAQFPRSAQLQAKNAEAASKAKQAATEAASKARQQAETERANKRREQIQTEGIKAGLTRAQISAKLQAEGLAQRNDQFKQTMEYNRSKPQPGQVTPAMEYNQNRADRVRQQKRVETLADDRDTAQQAAKRLEGLLANGFNPNGVPRKDKDGNIHPDDKNGVRYTLAQRTELGRQFRAAQDKADEIDAQIKQLKAGMGYGKAERYTPPPPRHRGIGGPG